MTVLVLCRRSRAPAVSLVARVLWPLCHQQPVHRGGDRGGEGERLGLVPWLCRLCPALNRVGRRREAAAGAAGALCWPRPECSQCTHCHPCPVPGLSLAVSDAGPVFLWGPALGGAARLFGGLGLPSCEMGLPCQVLCCIWRPCSAYDGLPGCCQWLPGGQLWGRPAGPWPGLLGPESLGVSARLPCVAGNLREVCRAELCRNRPGLGRAGALPPSVEWAWVGAICSVGPAVDRGSGSGGPA